jgi:hypothetical protein
MEVGSKIWTLPGKSHLRVKVTLSQSKFRPSEFTKDEKRLSISKIKETFIDSCIAAPF